MDYYYAVGATVVILLIVAIFWTISKDLKTLHDEIDDLHTTVNSQAHAIGELQRTTQRLLFREEQKEV